jgi:NADH-quinone oxidoreductase subunit G
VQQALVQANPELQAVVQAAPGADFGALGGRIPRQSFRVSGRTAVHAEIDVHEPRPPQDPDSPLAFSMEGYTGRPPAALIPRVWAPGWNSVQALNKFQREIAGPLLGEEPGRRLVKPAPQQEVPFYVGIPASPRGARDRWRAVRLYEIFGSEELSVLSSPVAERAPKAHIVLGPDDAAALGVADGEPVEVRLNERSVELPARIRKGLPPKTAGLPVGLPGIPFWDAETRIAIFKRKRHE